MQQSAKTSQGKTNEDKCGYAVRGVGEAVRGLKNNKTRKKSRQGKTSQEQVKTSVDMQCGVWGRQCGVKKTRKRQKSRQVWVCSAGCRVGSAG